MERRRKKQIISVIAAFLAGCLIASTTTVLFLNGGLGGSVRISKTEYQNMYSLAVKYQKLEQLAQNINTYYYQDVAEEDLLNGAYKGLVNGLDDPYSSYMTKEEYSDWKISATGKYSGVGITFSRDDTGYVIIRVNKESPAEKAGLKPGDYILSVDGKTYEDVDIMANAIRGDKGTKVKLAYYQDGKEHEVTLTRTNIVQQSVEYKMLAGDIGYIQVTAFLEDTAEDFDAALRALEEKGVKKLVLDLRDNGGGLVDACINIADEFLDEGVVTYVEDKQKRRTEYKSKDGKTDLKTVVLVNENSASASEILAGALQDNEIPLVGQKTFGKGIIQSTTELEDGSALKLTIMQYFSPKGRKVHQTGIKPDYVVKNQEDSKEDAQLEKALSLLQ